MVATLLAALALAQVTLAQNNYTNDLRSIRGTDYVPSAVHNDMGTWLDYDEAMVEKELGFASETGVNALRVFLHWLPWKHNRTQFMGRVEHMLATAEKNGQRVLFVVLDSCFGNVNAKLDWIDTKQYMNMSWIPNPGPEIVADASQWGEVDQYVVDLVSAHASDPRVLGWDVMNEPAFGSKGIDDFLEHYIRLVNSLDKTHFTTIGVAVSSQVHSTQDLVTVISYHNYHGSDGGKNLASDIYAMQLLGKQLGKPTMVTETMNRYFGSTLNKGQRLCSDVIPAVTAGVPGVANNRTGFFLWEQMLGVDQFNRDWQQPYQGMIFPNGSWWSESEHACLKSMTPQPTPAPAPGPPIPAPLPADCSSSSACTFIGDADAELHYSPTAAWTAWTGGGPLRGSLHYCNTRGCNASFAFDGAQAKAVKVVHKSGPDCGAMDVLVDAKRMATGVDTYSPSVDWGSSVQIELSTISPGEHTFTVVNTGAKGPHSSNSYVQIVGFEIYH